MAERRRIASTAMAPKASTVSGAGSGTEAVMDVFGVVSKAYSFSNVPPGPPKSTNP